MSPQVRSDVLKETKRILKKDGRLLIIDFHPGPLKKLKGIYSKVIITLSEILAGREHHKNYRNFMNNGGLPGLIQFSDFIIEEKKIVSGGNFGIYLLKLK
jgi:demethylmenaquinone methyltransferase/2-methoxy-6-polyprenyl-1,4-benzoquinol methylase